MNLQTMYAWSITNTALCTTRYDIKDHFGRETSYDQFIFCVDNKLVHHLKATACLLGFTQSKQIAGPDHGG